MKYCLSILLLIIFTSCASHRDVIYSLNDDSRPSWADVSNTIWEKDGKIYSLGFAELDYDDNLSAGFKVASNNAKSNLSSYIKNNITNDINNNQGLKNQDFNALTSEYSKVVTRKIKPEKGFYEKVSFENVDESLKYKLHVYSLISIEKNIFQKLTEENLVVKTQD